MIENKQTLTSIDISNMLEVHQIIELHKGTWIRKKLNVWMANEISEKNLHGMIICIKSYSSRKWNSFDNIIIAKKTS